MDTFYLAPEMCEHRNLHLAMLEMYLLFLKEDDLEFQTQWSLAVVTALAPFTV